MKKLTSILIIILFLLISSLFAIDGGQGIGQTNSKFEIGYTGGSFGLAYNYGLNNDFTIYGSLKSSAGVTGFGAGAKYAFLNEKTGDNFSFSGKLDLLVGGDTVFPMPGVIVSKQLTRFTFLGEASSFSIAGANFSWFGIGGLWNLNQEVQFAAEVGSYVSRSVGYRATSGLGIGLGVNIKI